VCARILHGYRTGHPLGRSRSDRGRAARPEQRCAHSHSLPVAGSALPAFLSIRRSGRTDIQSIAERRRGNPMSAPPDASLPPGFEALEAFVGHWAIEGADNRLRARLASHESDRIAFFNVAKDLLAAGLDYLDQRSIAGYNGQDNRLMLLLLS